MSATTIIFKPAGSSRPLESIPRPLTATPIEAAEARATIDSLVNRVGRVLARRPSVSLAIGTLWICALSWLSAFELQFEGAVPQATSSFMIRALPLVVLLKGIVLWMG